MSPPNKFDCPSVSCLAFFFVKLLHSQISAIHLEGIIIDRSDRKKYKIGTKVADAQSNVQLSPHKYSYIVICVYVCCNSRSLERHPRSEGWEVLGCTQGGSPPCHPFIPPTSSLFLVRPDLGPLCHQQMGLSQKDPSACQAGLLHTRLNLNSKVRIDTLSLW